MSLDKLNLHTDAPVVSSVVLPNLLKLTHKVDDPRRLPFVVEGKRGQGRNFWNPTKAFPGFRPSEQGVLCGAAYIEFASIPGSRCTWLASIIDAMPAECTATEISFLRFIEEHAIAAARLMDSHRIRRYAEKQIQFERILLSDAQERKDHVIAKLATALRVKMTDLCL